LSLSLPLSLSPPVLVLVVAAGIARLAAFLLVCFGSRVYDAIAPGKLSRQEFGDEADPDLLVDTQFVFLSHSPTAHQDCG